MSEIATEITVENKVKNLTGMLRGRRLTEGLNALDAADGVTLSAKVQGGVIVGYEFTDENGETVPSVYEAQKPLDSTGGETICRICRTHNGRRRCYDITCP
jgi:hypothetical protein